MRVELNRLTKAGLLETSNNGRTRLYQANTKHTLFPELHGLVKKYLGIEQLVDNALTQNGLERELFSRRMRTYVLDGDNVRHGLNSNLGFSREDRRENLRRIVELSKLMVDAGLIVLAAFISPYREDREYVRSRFDGDNFLEIYVRCSVEECERRDPKDNYKRARAGLIKDYTGVSDAYEEPQEPDLLIDTEKLNPENAIHKVLRLLEKKNFISLSE